MSRKMTDKELRDLQAGKFPREQDEKDLRGMEISYWVFIGAMIGIILTLSAMILQALVG